MINYVLGVIATGTVSGSRKVQVQSKTKFLSFKRFFLSSTYLLSYQYSLP